MSKNEEDRFCLYCEQAQEIVSEEYVLCFKKGVVRKDHCCKKFSLDLFKLKPAPNRIPQFDTDDNFHDILQ